MTRVASSFVVGRRPAGISAVVLRRGGKLETVSVTRLLLEAAALATTDVTSNVTKKKRKGRRK